MKKVKPILIILLTTLLLFSIVGCSDRYKENRRIIKKAERVAEEQAVSYIEDKYGFTPTPLGYDIQGGGTLAWNAHSEVVVKLSYENQIFYAAINIDKKGGNSDNYEKETLTKVFADYLLDVHNLTAPKQMDISFYLLDTRNYFFPISNDGVRAEEVTSMVNFKYNGQSAKELLEQVHSITYSLQYTEQGSPFDKIQLSFEDWPSHQKFSVNLNVCRYNDEKSYLDYQKCPTALWGDQPHPWVYRYLKEWCSSYIHYDILNKPDEPKTSRNYYAFQSMPIDDFTFITTLSDPLNELVYVSDEQKVWRKENVTVANEIHVTEYEQITPLFTTVPKEEKNRSYVVMFIPDEYVEKQGEDLHFGIYKSDGTFYTEIIPISMDEKVSNGYIVVTSRSQSLFSDEQYAILKRTSDYIIPMPSNLNVSNEAISSDIP